MYKTLIIFAKAPKIRWCNIFIGKKATCDHNLFWLPCCVRIIHVNRYRHILWYVALSWKPSSLAAPRSFAMALPLILINYTNNRPWYLSNIQHFWCWRKFQFRKTIEASRVDMPEMIVAAMVDAYQSLKHALAITNYRFNTAHALSLFLAYLLTLTAMRV